MARARARTAAAWGLVRTKYGAARGIHTTASTTDWTTAATPTTTMASWNGRARRASQQTRGPPRRDGKRYPGKARPPARGCTPGAWRWDPAGPGGAAAT